MPEIEIHNVPKGRLPVPTLANAILQLYPQPKLEIKKSAFRYPAQESIAPRENEEVVVIAREDGAVAAAAVGIVSQEVSVVRLSLIRGRSAGAMLGAIGALVEYSRQTDAIEAVFADALASTNKESILEAAGFRQTTMPHYPMPAGLAISVS